MESKSGPQGAPLSEAQLRAMLASPEGRRLLALIQHTDGAALRAAAAAAKAGDYAAVQQILTPYLQSPEAEALLRTLR